MFDRPSVIDRDPFAHTTRDTVDRGLLALDIATVTGWCTRTSSGIWSLGAKKDESAGMRLIRMRAKLKEVVSVENIQVVVFERPGGQHKNPIIVQSELMGCVKLFCEDHGIQYKAYSASEIKKFASGSGNCGKPEMIKQAKLRYNIEVVDDNEADALHLYHLAIEDLKL